jgi:hypothetical protein
VLHYDTVFDLIAKASGQPVEWVTAADSLDRPDGPRWPPARAYDRQRG